MKKIFTLFAIACLLVFKAESQVVLQQFSTGYTAPIEVENCGDSRLFIVQQSGQIMIADSSGKKINTAFIDISDRVLSNGEQGLLGLAFDPNYLSNGYFYVNYINKSGNTQISRFNAAKPASNTANPSSEKFILQIQQPFTNHNGGDLRFGTDGYLYIGMGDGGSGGDPNNNAQNPQSLLGKMLRIDVHHGDPYSIPASNPFADSSNYKKEIWALGLRNPFRWSFDPTTNLLIIADVGQDLYEEINAQPANRGGINYGWRCYEGKHPYNTSGCNPKSFYTLPVYEYQHSSTTGDCSIIGGFVYRGKKYNAFKGKYFFTDYCSGLIRVLTQTGSVTSVYNGDDYSYVSFGEDKNHELYIVNSVNGTIYQLQYKNAGKDDDDQIAAADNNLSISPNPSTGNFVLTYKSSKAQQISIHIQNALGQQFYMAEKNITSGINNISFNLRLPSGSYYLNVSDANGKNYSKQLRIE